MLERLSIKNFQKHRGLVIELDPGITVLTGESDVGKSSVLRALRWIATNRPSGNEFIRNGAKVTQVCMELDGGSTVLRQKGGNRNVYKTDGKVCTAFGQDVPDDIRNLLNTGPVNFQQQHDPPFWLTLSPGEVSRELNQIVNLGSIDASLSSIASELRKAKTTVEVSEGRLKEAKEREETLRWVIKASEELAIIEERERAAKGLRERAESLWNLLKEILAAKRSRTLYKRSSREGEAILERGEKVLTDQDKAGRLRGLLEKIKETEEELCQARKNATVLENELKEKIGDLCPLCGTALTTSRCSALICTSASDPP